ncbi:MAG: 50S ribosomal protein L24 [Candidatus Magasanikbacteria bacterium]|nr:50S ribosomal protein L24 [Candidatus Magasanikbacteria bacterium]
MKIKTGDKVKVLSGRNRGATGKVIQVLRRQATGAYYVVVDGVNVRKKHLRRRGRAENEKGQIIELAAPLHASKVMLLDPKSGAPTRVGYKIEGDKKKRVAKTSGEFLD